MRVLFVESDDVHAGRDQVPALTAQAIDDVSEAEAAVLNEGGTLRDVASGDQMSRHGFDAGLAAGQSCVLTSKLGQAFSHSCGSTFPSPSRSGDRSRWPNTWALGYLPDRVWISWRSAAF